MSNVIHLSSKDQLTSLFNEENSLVLIKFTATWCGPCRVMAPLFKDQADFHRLNDSAKKFIEVDIDQHSSLADSFKVYSVPCLVRVEQGKETDRVLGADPAKWKALILKN